MTAEDEQRYRAMPRAYYLLIFLAAALLVYFTPRRIHAGKADDEADRIEQLRSAQAVLWQEVERLTIKVDSIERWPIPVEVTVKEAQPAAASMPASAPTSAPAAAPAYSKAGNPLLPAVTPAQPRRRK